MSSRLIKLLNRSPNYISSYPTFLSFRLTRNNPIKPSFLLKNPYSSTASLSSSNTSNKKSKLIEYSPYIYSYFIWVIFGSMLLHLTWSKMSYNEYKERMQLKVTKLEETIANLQNDNLENDDKLLSTKSNSDHEPHNEDEQKRNNVTTHISTKPSSIKWV